MVYISDIYSGTVGPVSIDYCVRLFLATLRI